MSAVGLKFLTLLFLSCSALSDSGSGGVVRKKPGDDITIQCRPHTPGQENLCLYQGLGQEVRVAYVNDAESVVNITFSGKLRIQGTFPNVDITVSNLTTRDTHAYRCVYSTFTRKGNVNSMGLGSVLLVVTEDRAASVEQACESQHQSLVLVSVVISAVVLFGFIISALAWIFLKTKTRRISEKPRRQTNNDVYEEMRCTIGR